MSAVRRRAAAPGPPVRDAGPRRTVEVFTIGTRLTHVTRAMRLRDPERALVAAGETRARLVRRHPARRDAAALPRPLGPARDGPRRRRRCLQRRLGARRRRRCSASRCARLHRLAHRVVWVNPHRGKAGYQPVQQGIVAALPARRRLRRRATRCATFADLVEVVGRCVRCCPSCCGGGAPARPSASAPSSRRSAPRRARPAPSMLVGPDGEAVGSVSGGCVEGAVYELAQEVVGVGRPGPPALRRQRRRRVRGRADLRRHPRRVRREGRPARPSPSSATSPTTSRPAARSRSPPSSSTPTRRGSAGGSSSDPRTSRRSHAGRSARAARRRRGRRRRPGPAGLRAQRRRSPTAPTASAAARACGSSSGRSRPAPRMLVFGAIDFAAAVARMGNFLGYHVTVCDARPVFATARGSPTADEVVVDVAAPLPREPRSRPAGSTAAPCSACSPTTRSSTCRCSRSRCGCPRSPTSARWARGAPTRTGWPGCARPG